jgi:4-amino-4-deoxy-L-arabinose transferase-like glycosyltransferase
MWALAALLLMLIFLGAPPVQRTQEARVLETAREMLGQPWRDWMIPRLNGELRLEKPPLAYWLSAGAFAIGGVSEGVGRVPFALTGWATLLMTFGLANWLFNRRTALFSAAALMGGMMFAHLARQAETDILATCFVTAAIACVLRGAVGRSSRHSSANWYRLSGVMTGGVMLAKGLPFIFVLVLLLFLSIARRDWRMIWKWTRSGAPLLTALVGLPWYLYLRATVGLSTIREEAEIGMRGMEHTGSFIQYFPDLLRAVAPWSALMVLAIILAIAVWKAQPRVRGPLLWFAAVFVPLLFGGQRQAHYLLPALPALH